MYGNNLKTVPQGVDAKARLEEVRKRVFGPEGPKAGSAEANVPYLRCEHMLVRFLIARQWDVDKAVAMLSAHYAWLAETKMDELLNDSFPEEPQIKRYYPQAYHGTDKLGRPIYIERPGHIDMPRLLQGTSCERILSYCYAQSELQIRRRLPACSLMRGEVVDKSLNIMDLEGLSFRIVTHTTARKVVKDVVSMLQNHYPEMSGRMIIINAPKVFSIAWSFVKPQLDEKTVAKISIFGSDQREAYVQALLELVDADQLPALFGGKCTCDAKSTLSCMSAVKGPWADPEILQILEEHSFDEVLTPEGAKLLMQRRVNGTAGGSGLPEGSEVAESCPREAVAAPAAARKQEAGKEDAPQPEAPFRSRSAVLQPELSEAELDLAERAADLAAKDYEALDETHMTTLAEWVSEFNSLVEDIGRPVIERAQAFYDTRSLWQQAVQEFALQQDQVDLVSKELEAATGNLARAEAALESFLKDGCIVDLEPEGLSSDGYQAMEELQDAEPKFKCMMRVSCLADSVSALQQKRDAVLAEMDAKKCELEDARMRFELEEQQHSRCTWNCSVKRAAPFYEKRRLHELKVDQQLLQLNKAERRLQEKRRTLARLRGDEPRSPARSPCGKSPARALDELSLHSFEIAGGEPAQDEFLSCDEASSDEET